MNDYQQLAKACAEEYRADYNCAESLIRGADVHYGLSLDQSTLRVAAGFGGGLCVGALCGAVSGAVMALGTKYVDSRAHESLAMKDMVPRLLEEVEKQMGSLQCTELKERYHDQESGCVKVVEKVASILEELIEKGRSIPDEQEPQL